MNHPPDFNEECFNEIDDIIDDQFAIISKNCHTNHRLNHNVQNIDVPPNNLNENLSQNESEDSCMLFLKKFSPLSIFCLQNHNMNTKFMNTMLKLVDKYHVPFNLSSSKNDKNDTDNLSNQDDTDNDISKKDENKKKLMYKKFSKEEDMLLKNIVSIFGPKNWRLISSMIPNKTPRQCRDRYMNYLAPGFIHSAWTSEEDRLLAQKYVELGPQWSKIQRFFPYRTANAIKNRYKYTVCRIKGLSALMEKSVNNSTDIKDKTKCNQKVDEIKDKEFSALNSFHENANDDIDFSDCIFESFEQNENDLNFNYFNY